MPNGKHTSYLYAIFGITLVLFVMGIAAAMLVEAERYSADFKENLTIEVVLRDSLNADRLMAIQKNLQAKTYIKNVHYISKDEAAKTLQHDLGENFLDILGYNPLYASFSVNLYKNYANQDSNQMVKSELLKITGVDKVNIQTSIIETLDKNIRNASLVVLFIGGALLVFAVSLIFNTIRLALFSRRFTIKTMQLFGATRWFIIKPFLGRSIVNGFISGLLACLLVAGLIFYLNYALPELGLQRDLITFAVLSAGIILFGIIISFFSTLTAILRYLRVQLEDLY